MRNAISISTIILLSLLLVYALDSCKKSTLKGTITAYVSDNSMCPAGDIDPNFVGDHLYAYRADNTFGMVPTIQAGGYTSDDQQELGVNLFELVEQDFEEGSTYLITSGSDIFGTGYLFYIPDVDMFSQYTSTEEQDAVITITKLIKGEEDPDTGYELIEEITIEVDGNVTMVNWETGDTICIKDITIELMAE